ncbi:hypothetical protein [Chryseobacterium indoltheticum]|jgi:hypothetical protein|uniref:hypothetical protein n=1 Tax=Chryseobacterium indoltheticum TaxID=254 RepID=UPI00242FEAFB|nr:hypothetical protein [Chryseobacterium indoltheticum]MDF2832230.1 hypothetical protein [Chryseobacterium indoltheticum]
MKKILFFLLISANVFTFAQQTDKEDIKKAIKKESIGGRMDFSKMVEEKYSYAPLIGFGNTLYNKKDFAILLWGAKVKNLGIESLDETNKLWEEIYKRTLTDSERKALKTGFETKTRIRQMF